VIDGLPEYGRQMARHVMRPKRHRQPVQIAPEILLSDLETAAVPSPYTGGRGSSLSRCPGRNQERNTGAPKVPTIKLTDEAIHLAAALQLVGFPKR
jgi:hypothetical protein